MGGILGLIPLMMQRSRIQSLFTKINVNNSEFQSEFLRFGRVDNNSES